MRVSPFKYKSPKVRLILADYLDASEPSRLFENARRLAPKIDVAPKALDFLFNRSRFGLSRQKWETRLRTSYALNMLIRVGDIEPNSLVERRTGIQLPKCALVLLSHNGHTPPAIASLLGQFESPLQLTTGDDEPNQVDLVADPRAALFCGLKALLGGRTVLLAPDGKAGGNSKITVLGMGRAMGAGAAFLAYESRRPIVWYNLIWREGRFVSHVEYGPVRFDGESYAHFDDRVKRFYEAVMNDHLSGDPLGMVVSSPLLGRIVSHREKILAN